MICGETVTRHANGAGGLPRYTETSEPCGRPAVVLVRGIIVRKRARHGVYLKPWRPKCRYHETDPNWERDMRAEYPSIGNRPLLVWLKP